ncbi:protein xpaC [Bacillus sp. FJAT-27225]|uniref:5-bromo-4-chloroindolyl phosphate hydrolysis family protein n=1 Tax=Bacillus sp. FJAT-27225 TaxID=1743144 RepID=UPI00080C271D|nr:5-bromo-4-chloroindolyl phosphate hydrolysis family protein [Bacillus sp. FJAT-27225]OCA82445.1 protein xpaC [Bacillus sp. FJAT-27225]
MNPFLSFLLKSSIAVPTAVTAGAISFFGFDTGLLLATGISAAGGFTAYKSVGMYTNSQFLKKHSLTRKEYRYIKQNLEEGKRKINRLHKALFSIKNLPSLKQRIELLRITKKIYKLTKDEPKRFYKAERFYFSHLDSLIELAEKYAFLSAQPKRNPEIELKLHETQRTLDDMADIVEQDLYYIIRDDIDHLDFEIDVAKKVIEKQRGIKIPEDNRRLK